VTLPHVMCSQSLSSLEGDNDDTTDDDDDVPPLCPVEIDSTTTAGPATSSRGHVTYGGTRIVSISSAGGFVGVSPSSSSSQTTTIASKIYHDSEDISKTYHDNAEQSTIRQESNRKSKLLRRNTLSTVDNGIKKTSTDFTHYVFFGFRF